MSNSGMGGHQSQNSGKDEWLTPPWILEKLGRFNLDPCSPVNRPWPIADRHYTIEDNGLNQEWEGRVFCNPPYGREAAQWLDRCAAHCNATVLLFARTETLMFFEHIWPKAHAVLFIKGRVHFHHVDGRRASGGGGAPSVLIAYGESNANQLRECGVPGKYIDLIG